MKTKSQIKRIIVVFMAATVALSALAVGYGHWQDRLDVSVVTTTTVGDFACFGFVDVTTDDKGPPINPAPPLGIKDHTVVSPIYYFDDDTYRTFGYTTEEEPVPGEVAKDVAYTNAVRVNADGECGGEEVLVTIENGYPSYASVTTVGFKNYGPDTAVTITGEGLNLPEEMVTAGYYLQYYSPGVAGIQHSKCYVLRKLAGPGGPDGNTPDPSNDPLDINDTVPYTFGDGADNDNDGLTDEDPAVMDLCWMNYEGEIVQPGSTTIGALKVHVLQPAEQDVDYIFSVWVEVWPY
jgi:hypothetical protein